MTVVTCNPVAALTFFERRFPEYSVAITVAGEPCVGKCLPDALGLVVWDVVEGKGKLTIFGLVQELGTRV